MSKTSIRVEFETLKGKIPSKKFSAVMKEADGARQWFRLMFPDIIMIEKWAKECGHSGQVHEVTFTNSEDGPLMKIGVVEE